MLEDPTLAATGASVSRPSAEDSLRLRRGESTGRFVIIDELGRGAMGTVYAAFDVKLERQIALKLLHRSDRGMGSLLAEAQALARVNHPNVVTVYDVGEHEGRLYLAMELVHGRTLRQWRKDTNPTWREIIETYRMAARGLHAVHVAELIHGDFKPDNVMVADDGRVLVMDFGIARSLDGTLSGDDLTASNSGSRSLDVSRIRGTPAYMAPEQFRLEGVGPASDQFAFCVALHEALWGERPFDGSTLAELSSNVVENRRQPRSGRDIPRVVGQIVDRGLASAVEDRFESMRALDEAFDQSLRRRLQTFSLLGAAGLTTVVGMAVALAPTEESPCDIASERFERSVHGSEMKALQARFEEIEHPDAATTSRQFEENVDAFANAWHEANAALCTSPDLAPDLRDARRHCLDRQHDALDVIVSVYGEMPSFDLSKVSNLASTFPQPSQCSTLEDPDAPEATNVEALIVAQQVLARARALHETGRTLEGVEEVQAQLETVRELEAYRLEANMNLWIAGKLRFLGRFDEALAATKTAQFAAARSGAKDLPCLGWLDRVYHTETVSPNDAALIASQLEAAELALIDAGNLPDLRIRYLMRRANAESASGDPEAAIDSLTEALALSETDPPRKLVLSNIHNLRALAHIQTGNRALAHEDFQRAHDILEAAYGPYYPTLAQSRANLGSLCAETGDLQCARDTFESALRTLEASSSPSPTAKSHLQGSLAEITYWLGDPDASKRHALASLRSAEEAGFAELAPTLLTRVVLLRAYRLEEDWEAGDAVLEALLRVNEAQLGGTAEAARALQAAAKYTYAKEDFEGALAYAQRARDIVEAHLPADGPKLAVALQMEATALVALGRLEEAEAALERATALLDTSKDPSTLDRMSIAHTRARLLEAAGEHDAAAALASDLIRSADGTDPTQAKAREELVAWMEQHGMTPPAFESDVPRKDSNARGPAPLSPG